jgi:phage shock protein A
MPRTFRLERDDPFGKTQMTNQELVQNNQKLQGRVQKLTAAYQQVEQQNVILRDRCLRLQNRVDELKEYLAAIKVTFHQD